MLSDWHTDGNSEAQTLQTARRLKQQAKRFAMGDSDGMKEFKVKQPRMLPNLEVVAALNNALQQGMGIGLEDFLLQQDSPAALPAGSRRYFLKEPTVPAHLCSAIGATSRSCLQLADGATRLEANWLTPRKVLHEVIDCGSIGWPARQFLYYEGGIRGSATADPPHARYNHFKAAVKESGLWGAWVDGTVLISLRKGPWSGGAHFQALRSLAEHLIAHSDYKDPIFRLCLHDILHHLYSGKVPDFVDEDSCAAATWPGLLHSDCIQQRGGRAQNSRWFAWPSSMQHLMRDLGWLKMLCLHMALSKGWLEQCAEWATGLFSVPPSVEVRDGEDEDAQPDVQMEPEQTRQRIDPRRASQRSTMTVACSILWNETQVKQKVHKMPPNFVDLRLRIKWDKAQQT